MATAGQWLEGARPRTLPAAIAPVAAGTAAAVEVHHADLVRALLALVVSLALQVGVNFANDYSDGIRGTDALRVGPFRLVASGTVRPAVVKFAAFAAFGFGGLAGLALVALSSTWWLLVVGALAIAAAWFYTGGQHPYGYVGLGEVFVFVFFGLVAVLGTTYTQAGRVTLLAWVFAVAIGAVACAILVANNVRDISSDTASGKRTLAVRMGDLASRAFYVALLVTAFGLVAVAGVAHRPAWLGLLAIVPAVGAVRRIRTARGRDLIPVLRDTGLAELALGLLLLVGFLLFG